MKKFSLIVLCSVLVSCKPKADVNEIQKSYTVMDSYYLNKYQKTLDEYIDNEIILFEKEELYTESLLNDEKQVVDYATFIYSKKFPTSKQSFNKKNVFLGKDKSGNVWFVRLNLPDLLHDNFYIMIMKNNCKVIYFSRFMK